jgi:gas vesicle protein
MAEKHRDNDEQRIRSRIEARRARMGATIEEVGAHLNPDHLKDEFRTGVREQVEQTKREIRGATIGRAETLINDMEDTVNRTRRTLMETIRDNPVPAAMAGIGLGWLIVDARRHDSDDDYDGYAVGGRYDREHYGRYGGEYGAGARSYDRQGIASTGPGYVGPYGRTAPPMRESYMRGEERSRGDYDDSESRADRIRSEASDRMDDVRDAADRGREKLSDAADEARDAAERVQDRAHDAAERAREGASDLAHRAEDAWHDAEYRARRAGRQVRHLGEENPLAAGAVALALGFAAGMLVPETSREHRLMGPARDRLVDRAQEAASDTMEKVGRVAEKTAEEARETAEEEAERQGLVDDGGSSGDGLSDRPAGGL